VFIQIFKPFVWLIAQLSKGILAVLGIKEKSHTDDISSEELY
jgi:Mg2+/Co2+ transporter CorB